MEPGTYTYDALDRLSTLIDGGGHHTGAVTSPIRVSGLPVSPLGIMGGMKRLSWAVIGLLLLSLTAHVYAQNQPRFRHHLPCVEVLHLGLDKYFAQYTAATHDRSTAGCIEAYDSYAQCRRSINDVQVRALSHARRGQVIQVRRNLDTLSGACYDYIYLSMGGGTMWSEMEAYADAAREDFLATLIVSLRHPGNDSPAARRQVEAALRVSRRSLGTLRVPLAGGASMMEASYVRKYRNHTFPAACTALARLQALSTSLPDMSARRLAREIQQELAVPQYNLR